MAQRKDSSIVSRNDDLPDRYGPTSALIPPNNDKMSQRMANVLNSGLGRADAARQITDVVITDYTHLWGAAMRDYANGHDFATRVTMAYEQEYPESPYDIRRALGDMLSDGATAYRGMLDTYLSAAQQIIVDHSHVEEDDRPLWQRIVFGIPKDE